MQTRRDFSNSQQECPAPPTSPAWSPNRSNAPTRCGFNDPRALRLANGNSVMVQTDAEGNSYAPWRLDIKDTRITWMGSLPHSRESQVDAWNEGRHDGWLDAKRSSERDYADLHLTM